MKDRLVHSSLTLGLIVFGVCGFSVLIKAAQVALIVSHLLPGFLFGMLLVTINNDTRERNKLSLLMLSTGIYILCVYLLDLRNSEKWIGPLRLLVASVLGAVLLTNFYWILARRIFTIKRCLIFPVLLGCGSSLISCLSMHYLYIDNYYEEYLKENLIWMGLLSIFPMWMTLVSMNIAKLTPRGNATPQQ